MKKVNDLKYRAKNMAKFIFRRKIIRPAVFILLLIWLVKYCSPQTYEVVEPETQVHYKLERFGGSARLYISRTDTFGSDYVEFNHTAIFFPEIYYVEPDTLYFIDDGSFYLRDVKFDRFVIKTIDKISFLGPGPPSTKEDVMKIEKNAEQSDSIRTAFNAKPHYKIRFTDYARGISIYNPQGEQTANKEAPYTFRGS